MLDSCVEKTHVWCVWVSRKGRLRQLQGVASVEDVRQLEKELVEAFEEEQSAAEFFVSEDLRIRVRVPRPIGTPLENLSDGVR
jgi:hypothetical protein